MSKNDPLQRAFKVYNFISGKGGRIEFLDLIQHPSPLKSLSEAEATEWLREFNDLNDKEDVIEKPCFVVERNCEGRTTVRICVKVRLCQNYERNGNCRYGRDCLQFHVCKGFLEGRCTNSDECSRSHDLHDKENLNKIQKYRLGYLGNSSIRKIIISNIPFVCENYVNDYCRSRFCPNVHVCSRFVRAICEDREDYCPFKLSHDLQSPHNKRIFKDFCVPQKYILCNILVSKDTKIDVEGSEAKSKGKVNKLNNLNVNDGNEKIFGGYSKLGEFQQNILPNALEDPRSKGQQRKGMQKKDISNSNQPDMRPGLLPTPNPYEKQYRRPDVEKRSSLPTNTRGRYPVKPAPLMAFPMKASGFDRPDFQEEFHNMLFPQDLESQYQNARGGQGQKRGLNIQLSRGGRKWKSMDHFQNPSPLEKPLYGQEEENSRYGVGRGRSIGARGGRGRGSWRGRGRGSLPFEKEEALETEPIASSKEEVPSIEESRRGRRPRVRKRNARSKSTDGDTTTNIGEEEEEDVEDLKKDVMEFSLEDKEEQDLIDLNELDDASNSSDLVDLNFDSDPGLSQASEAQVLWDIFSQDQLYDEDSLQDNDVGSISDPIDSSPSNESSNALVASGRAVFHYILQESGGKVSFSEISSNTSLFNPDYKDHEKWFKDHPSSFLMLYNQNGQVVEIKTITLRAKMCFKYYWKGCNSKSCHFFHVCKTYISKGRCDEGVSCKKSHGFSDDHNKNIASNLFRKEHYNDEQLQCLVQSSNPQVCLNYNNGHCRLGKHCTKIHICKNYGKKRCVKGSCKLAHNNGLCTTATKRILDRFKIKGLTETDGYFLAKTLLVCDDVHVKKITPTAKKEKKKSETTTCSYQISNNLSSHICLKFLLNRCKMGSKCAEHHCLMPYQWVYYVDSKWHMLDDNENLNLERFFCNESLADAVITLTLSHSSSSSMAQAQQNESYFYKIDFNEMQIKPLDEEGLNFPVKRLSTESEVHIPDCKLATRWCWFWKGPEGKFTEYQPCEDSKDPTSATIEKHFLEGNSTYNFRITESHNYRLYFRKEPMVQKNLDPIYETEREVCRRPQYVSKPEFENIKGATQKLPPEDSRQMPQLWKRMAECQQFLLHPLKSQSKEFKEMQTLFLDSVKREATINSIDRVQNPFMMEKYLRKKVQMQKLAGASEGQNVKELFLFHGTSHLNIRPICRQNFDWRLYGEVTGNVYGEGAYFARNAHTADCYCNNNEDGLRYMFVVKVLVGSYAKGNKKYKRPPPKDVNDPHDLFDSCVDEVDDPKIFVVFDVDQYYPAYLIEYKRDDLDLLNIPTSHSSASSYSFSSSSLPSSRYDPSPSARAYEYVGTGASQATNLASAMEKEVEDFSSTSSSKKSSNQSCLVM